MTGEGGKGKGGGDRGGGQREAKQRARGEGGKSNLRKKYRGVYRLLGFGRRGVPQNDTHSYIVYTIMYMYKYWSISCTPSMLKKN